jgi:ribosomal-protein-alanine N-acetyltransferase
LRPLERSDAAAMFEALNDPQVMNYWDWPGAQSMEEAQAFVDSLCDEVDQGQSIYWAICLGLDLIGTCDLSEIDDHHKRADVGFMVIRRHWNKGYAFEAMQAVIGYGARQLKLERLSARTHSGNAASAALLAKLGFAQEGTLKGFILRDGRRRDCALFGRLLA